jgi:hypothetical protein
MTTIVAFAIVREVAALVGTEFVEQLDAVVCDLQNVDIG